MTFGKTEVFSATLQKLLTLTERIDDDWLNKESQAILLSEEYAELLGLFPSLKEIFEDGAKKEPQEFGRTLSHIFRSIAIYNQLIKASFQQPSLSQDKIDQVYGLFAAVSKDYPHLMPIILWFHDIGKMEDRENHTQVGFELIEKYGLLDNLALAPEENILVKKVIQHHLVIGTLYTGEGSFYILKSIVQDPAMQELITHFHGGGLWTDFSTMFTIIDLCGYPYNKLTNTHIDSYLHLMETIMQVFSEQHGQTQRLERRIEQVAEEMTDWRLACFLRMFLFLHRTPEHTFENYLKALLKASSRYLHKEVNPETWKRFKQDRLSRFSRIQFKYGLAFFCRLGLSSLDQWLNPAVPEEANPQLFRFMVSLDERIAKEESGQPVAPDRLWEVTFQSYPKWGEDNKLIEETLVKPGVIEEFVESGIASVNSGSLVNRLNFDFKRLLQ